MIYNGRLKMRKAYFIVLTICCVAFCSIFTLSQSDGPYMIQRSIIAGGGGQSAGNGFVVNGTIGQHTAGTTSTGGAFQLTGGFWGGTAAPAANVTISGRVFASNGLTGLRNAGVTLTDSLGIVRTATTSSFGFYSFDNVAPGFAYTIRISSRSFRYPPQTVVPTGDLANVDFIGLE